MRRRAFAIIVGLGLAACSQNGPGREAINSRCIAGGESPEICKCLADTSADKLEGDLFPIVVAGARGEEAASEKLINDLAPDRKARFGQAMREIARSCGADAYIVAN